MDDTSHLSTGVPLPCGMLSPAEDVQDIDMDSEVVAASGTDKDVSSREEGLQSVEMQTTASPAAATLQGGLPKAVSEAGSGRSHAAVASHAPLQSQGSGSPTFSQRNRHRRRVARPAASNAPAKVAPQVSIVTTPTRTLEPVACAITAAGDDDSDLEDAMFDAAEALEAITSSPLGSRNAASQQAPKHPKLSTHRPSQACALAAPDREDSLYADLARTAVVVPDQPATVGVSNPLKLSTAALLIDSDDESPDENSADGDAERFTACAVGEAAAEGAQPPTSALPRSAAATLSRSRTLMEGDNAIQRPKHDKPYSAACVSGTDDDASPLVPARGGARQRRPLADPVEDTPAVTPTGAAKSASRKPGGFVLTPAHKAASEDDSPVVPIRRPLLGASAATAPSDSSPSMPPTPLNGKKRRLVKRPPGAPATAAAATAAGHSSAATATGVPRQPTARREPQRQASARRAPQRPPESKRQQLLDVFDDEADEDFEADEAAAGRRLDHHGGRFGDGSEEEVEEEAGDADDYDLADSFINDSEGASQALTEASGSHRMNSGASLGSAEMAAVYRQSIFSSPEKNPLFREPPAMHVHNAKFKLALGRRTPPTSPGRPDYAPGEDIGDIYSPRTRGDEAYFADLERREWARQDAAERDARAAAPDRPVARKRSHREADVAAAAANVSNDMDSQEAAELAAVMAAAEAAEAAEIADAVAAIEALEPECASENASTARTQRKSAARTAAGQGAMRPLSVSGTDQSHVHQSSPLTNRRPLALHTTLIDDSSSDDDDMGKDKARDDTDSPVDSRSRPRTMASRAARSAAAPLDSARRARVSAAVPSFATSSPEACAAAASTPAKAARKTGGKPPQRPGLVANSYMLEESDDDDDGAHFTRAAVRHAKRAERVTEIAAVRARAGAATPGSVRRPRKRRPTVGEEVEHSSGGASSPPRTQPPATHECCVIVNSSELQSGGTIVSALRNAYGMAVYMASGAGPSYTVSHRVAVVRMRQSDALGWHANADTVARLRNMQSDFVRAYVVVEKDPKVCLGAGGGLGGKGQRKMRPGVAQRENHCIL